MVPGAEQLQQNAFTGRLEAPAQRIGNTEDLNGRKSVALHRQFNKSAIGPLSDHWQAA
jgi:hypothetical protein